MPEDLHPEIGRGASAWDFDVPDPSLAARLHAASLSLDRTACPALLRAARADGIHMEELADIYIPAIARVMGEQWLADELGFAQVTIGVSRLQAALRELGNHWSGDLAAPDAQMTVLMIVPHECSHILGAMLVAGQLRRRGISVGMMLEATPSEIRHRLRRAPCDACFVSAACSDNVERLRNIVEAVKSLDGVAVPIVIGGGIVDLVPNVRALTGADHVTKNIDEALELCGLTNERFQPAKTLQGS